MVKMKLTMCVACELERETEKGVCVCVFVVKIHALRVGASFVFSEYYSHWMMSVFIYCIRANGKV